MSEEMAKIYQKLVEVATDNGIIKNDVKEIKSKVTSFDTRISGLEKTNTFNAGAIKIIGIVGTICLGVGTWFVKDYFTEKSTNEAIRHQVNENRADVHECYQNLFQPKI